MIAVRESLTAVPALKGAFHVPHARLSAALPGIPPDRKVVVCCLRGELGLQAVALLRAAGCEQAMSLSGGLLAYFREFDPIKRDLER